MAALPPVQIGDIILASLDPINPTLWVPAVVERVGENSQVVATAFVNGGTMALEGCKHIHDPWWDDTGRKKMARDEGIAVWKERKTVTPQPEKRAVKGPPVQVV